MYNQSVLSLEAPNVNVKESIYEYRLTLVKERCSSDLFGEESCSPRAAALLLKKFLAGVDREHFVLLLLNTKNKVTGIHVVSVGSLDSSLVHPREVFKPAVLANCASIILGHNHPSGDPQPSREDIGLTKRLKDAGELMGIPVLDHIVVGDGSVRYFSFKEESFI